MSLLWPMLAQIGWTFLLYVWLTVARQRAVKRGDVEYGSFAHGEEPHHVARITRNLANQFELPVIFYAVIELGGPEALSPLDVVHLAEQVTRKRFAVQHVPEEALGAQYGSATDPLQQSFAALMLYYARGDVIDMQETLRAFPGQRLKSVREYFEAGTQAALKP